jgi:ribosomal-protein-alanine N-acetyltransferase
VSGDYVTRATLLDVDGLVRLHRVCHSHPWTASQIAAEIGQAPPAAVLVVRGGRDGLVRASCAYRLLEDEVEILDVAVDPDWRGRGLARLLVGLAVRSAARAGARRALLEVRAGNTAARALYASLGFRELGQRRAYYREPVEDALLLERPLSLP